MIVPDPPETSISQRKFAGKRVVAMATSFGALHIVHTLLNLGFTLVQLLVFARGLDAGRYAEIVFLTAVGVYLQPVDQAIGRANYAALSAKTGEAGKENGGAIVWTLHSQALLLTIISFAVPLWFGVDDPQRYVGNALYLFGCLFTNYWSYDLQSTVWSAQLARPFAFISVIRRLLFFAALGLFWMTGEFLYFGIATTAIIVLFMIVLIRLVAKRSPALSPFPGAVSRPLIVNHLRQFWTSLLSSISELLVLNSPYTVLTLMFGVGPVLVAFDTVMKVGRLAMAGTRTFSEIALPRISRQVAAGDMTKARSGLVMIIGVCVVATAVPAGAILFYGPFVFSLLLGPNNVVPPEAAPAAALIVISTALYQPAAFFLSYLNASAVIRQIAWLALVGSAVYAAAIWWQGADIIGSLWIYAMIFLLLSIVATVQLVRIRTWIASKPQ